MKILRTAGPAAADPGFAQDEALRRDVQQGNQEMFERFFECAPDAVLVTDAQGRITDANQQAKTMFGYPQEEMLGAPVEMLLPEHLRGKHRIHREAYMGDPKMRALGRGLELFGRRRDGSLFPVDITLSPLLRDGELCVLAGVRDICEHRLAEERLQESLREKEVLLREVHHRVKNNLAVICSLFYLESTYARNEHTAQVFRESENRVHAMALVHETLYGSKDLSRIDFGEYAHTLAVDILSSYGTQRDPEAPVQLKCELEPVIVSIELAVPCGLILNELISNAMKHGFRGRAGGEIRVALRSGPDGVAALRVEDNGAGIPPGLDANSQKSLGLRLVRSLTNQIRGSFELARLDRGTSARLNFPVRRNTSRETQDL